MIKTVYRDQAVWEREIYEIEVPDDLPEDEHYGFVFDAIENWDHDAHPIEPFVTDSIEGLDIILEIQP
jgi:hypothetical protein